MDNELITKNHESVKSFFLSLERLSKALESLFGSRKASLDGDSFYTDAELAKKLRVSQRCLQDYRDEGLIPYVKLGGKILYRSSDIEKLLEDGYRESFRK